MKKPVNCEKAIGDARAVLPAHDPAGIAHPGRDESMRTAESEEARFNPNVPIVAAEASARDRIMVYDQYGDGWAGCR